MQIIFTRTINKQKGWIKGAMRDWPRSTIAAIDKTQEKDWYKTSEDVQEAVMSAQDRVAKNNKIRKDKEDEQKKAEEHRLMIQEEVERQLAEQAEVSTPEDEQLAESPQGTPEEPETVLPAEA